MAGGFTGQAYVYDPDDRFLRRFDESHVKLYRSTELAELLYAAGFERVSVRKLWSGGYALVRAGKPAASV